MTQFHQLVAIIAALALVIFAIAQIIRPNILAKSKWIFPAALSVAFTIWSLIAVATEGPTGFWPEHVKHFWGNQIWFDLLLAVGVAWFFIAPQARKLGMNLWFWLAFTLCSGSIGLLAMVSRLLYLQATQNQKS